MDSETRQLLSEAVTLSRENNKMLKSMHRAGKRTRAFAFIKMVVGLVLAYVAYMYIAPYLNTLVDMYNSIQGGLQGLKF